MNTPPSVQPLSAHDADSIGRAAGVATTITPDGVVRIGWARDDTPVTVDGMALPPAAGLGSWAAFAATPGGTMVMGDTVVFANEVGPAMDAALANGLQVSALHNHFFFDEPKVYFMHIGGHGQVHDLARGVKAVWDAIKDIGAHAAPARTFAGPTPPQSEAIDAAAIADIVGHAINRHGAVVKVTIGRAAVMHHTRIGGSMGLTTWAAFVGSNARATIDGDFAMTAAEVQPVLRALRAANMRVVALHNHMIGEEPAYYFAHFWSKGSVADLARGFRAALDAQARASGDRQSARGAIPLGDNPVPSVTALQSFARAGF